MGKERWLKHNRTDEIVEIIIRDFTGMKLDSFKFNLNEKKVIKTVASILSNKYGLIFPVKDEDELTNSSLFS